MPEHILILLCAGAKNYDLNLIPAQLIHHICDQIKALLVCQTGYNTNHHLLGILCKSQLSLQCSLVLNLLFSEILNGKIIVNPCICLRIPIGIIQTIYNSGQAVRTGIHKAVQLLTVKRSLNLLRICITYCCYPVSIDNSALQIVGILVCLELVRDKIILRKPCHILNPLGIPCTLELQVVDRHDRLDPPEIFIAIAEIIQIYRNKSCLPVVAVDDVRPVSDQRKCAEHCLREESKLLNISKNLSVRCKSVKVPFIIYKIERNSFVFQLQNSYVL